jgi:thiol-disulfide isomerase/thioredoxin
MKVLLSTLVILFTIQFTQAQVPIDTAVDFSVKDIYGNTIELFPLLDDGKLVVINFFSTSCGPCGLYAPEFQASYEDFGENSGNVYFVGICWGDGNAGVAYFDSIYHLTHPSVSGSQGGGNIVFNNYQVISTPTVILINPEREIVEQHIWEPTRENINAAVIAAGGSMVGINDLSYGQDLMQIYPNPARSVFNASFSASGQSLYHVEVYSVMGLKVKESLPRHFSQGDQTISVHLTGLPSGTYFIRLLSDKRVISNSKLLIPH